MTWHLKMKDDLLRAIEQELRKRRLGGSTVAEIEASTPEGVRRLLRIWTRVMSTVGSAGGI